MKYLWILIILGLTLNVYAETYTVEKTENEPTYVITYYQEVTARDGSKVEVEANKKSMTPELIDRKIADKEKSIASLQSEIKDLEAIKADIANIDVE